MGKIRTIQIRVTDSQYKRIILKKEYLGYKTLSHLIRDLLLKEDLAVLNLLQEIHQEVLKKKK